MKCTAAIAALALITAPALTAQDVQWLELTAARKQAAADGRPLLVVFRCER